MIEKIDMDELLFYLDKNALFAGQWQFRRTKNQNKEVYNSFLSETAEPILNNCSLHLELLAINSALAGNKILSPCQ